MLNFIDAGLGSGEINLNSKPQLIIFGAIDHYELVLISASGEKTTLF